MIRSENTFAHAFISLFLERILHIPQLFTAISLVHSYQITLGQIRNFHLYYISYFRQPTSFLNVSTNAEVGYAKKLYNQEIRSLIKEHNNVKKRHSRHS